MTIKGLFGPDSSKSTKVATEVAHVILIGILMRAKTGDSWGRHIGTIQNGHHPVRSQLQFKN